jgi:hypothetical protein
MRSAPTPSLQLESLQPRVLMAATAGLPSVYYSYDGTGNNVANASLGATGGTFIRYAPAAYGDGVSTPAGANRPSPRVVSNVLVAEDSAHKSARELSQLAWVFGQFIDHDLDLTPTGSESLPIKVPTGDPYFDPAGTGTKTISFTRSSAATGTGTSAANPRQQTNLLSSWIDGSQIYGSDKATADSLRTFAGGKLKTGANNMLPLDATGQYMAGDVRTSENILLTSLHTVFMREHNATADRLARQNPGWTDEQLYQEARRWVIGELQAVTFNEFLPALLGKPMPAYLGYNPNENPTVANEFATAIFRIGHTMLEDEVEFLGPLGQEVHDSVSLSSALFNSPLLTEVGVDPVLKYAVSDNGSEIDTLLSNSVRNFLFGAPGSGGFDLASLNIQRGRDHGLTDYNRTRAAVGLPRVTRFDQITTNPDVAAKLQQTYGTVDNIDLWVGMLAEDHAAGASVGPLASKVITDQFLRIRAADRLWYQRSFAPDQVRQLDGSRLSDLIARNSGVKQVQRDALFFDVNVAGAAFNDFNRNGRRDFGETPIANARVDLFDSTGTLVASTRTAPDGRYRFADVDTLGDFSVRLAPPGQAGRSVRIDRGGDYAVDLAAVPPAMITAQVTTSSLADTLSTTRDVLGALSSQTLV